MVWVSHPSYSLLAKQNYLFCFCRFFMFHLQYFLAVLECFIVTLNLTQIIKEIFDSHVIGKPIGRLAAVEARSRDLAIKRLASFWPSALPSAVMASLLWFLICVQKKRILCLVSLWTSLGPCPLLPVAVATGLTHMNFISFDHVLFGVRNEVSSCRSTWTTK